MPVGMPADAETFRKYSTWFLVYGIVLLILGVLAILMPGLASLAATILLGWLLLISGVVGVIGAFYSGTATPGFWWHLLTAVLYLVAGILLLWNPIAGVLTLTIILAAYLLAGGVMKLLLAFGYRATLSGAWGWVLLSAIVDIVLGILIVTGLPGTAVWVLGLIVGINFLFMGLSIVMAAMHCRRVASGTA